MYVCMCVCVCAYVIGQHFFIKIYLIKKYRHLLFRDFCVYLFKSLNRSFNLRLELVYKFSKVGVFQRTFRPIMGHHQGRVCCKCNKTFEKLQLYKC